MSKLRIYGDTSGYIDVAAPATADNSTLDLSTVAKTTGANTFTDTLEVYKAGTSEILIGSDNGGTAQLSFYENNSGTKEGFIKYDGTANTLNMGTSGSGNAISIGRDTGYITTPYQPAFRAVTNNSENVTSGNTVPFDYTGPAYEGFNRGNNFNTGTYSFVAPIDGVYHFDVVLFRNNNNTDTEMALQHNGVDVLISRMQNNNNGYMGLSLSGVLSLSANDTVRVVNVFGIIHANGTKCAFSGHLVG